MTITNLNSIINSQFPKSPMLLRIDQTNFLDPNIYRSCGPKSHLNYTWSIVNYFDTSIIYKDITLQNIFQIFFFPETIKIFDTNSAQLKIPKYSLWFDDLDDPFRFLYVVKIQVHEIFGNKNGTSTSRVIYLNLSLIISQNAIDIIT